MAKPLIGITTYVTPAKWSYWELEAALIPVDYVRAVERAGGRPLLVPPSEDGVEETLEALDGLLFSGGSDLDPGLYDQEPHDETFGIHEARDRAELALLEAALERDMPVLAICRGSQVLNVARGGDLVQHLPDVVGDEKHKHTPGTYADHDVTLEALDGLLFSGGSDLDPGLYDQEPHEAEAYVGRTRRVWKKSHTFGLLLIKRGAVA